MKVVIHFDELGNFSAFADEGAAVYCVDERFPADRIYKMSPPEIPTGMLDGSAGHADDGSAAEARVKKWHAEVNGEKHLSVVKADEATP